MDEQFQKHLAHMHAQAQEVLAKSKKRAEEHQAEAVKMKVWAGLAFDAVCLSMIGLGLAFLLAHAWAFFLFFVAADGLWIVHHILSRRMTIAFYKLGVCEGAHSELSILLQSLEKAARLGKSVEFKDGSGSK